MNETMIDLYREAIKSAERFCDEGRDTIAQCKKLIQSHADLVLAAKKLECDSMAVAKAMEVEGFLELARKAVRRDDG